MHALGLRHAVLPLARGNLQPSLSATPSRGGTALFDGHVRQEWDAHVRATPPTHAAAACREKKHTVEQLYDFVTFVVDELLTSPKVSFPFGCAQ